MAPCWDFVQHLSSNFSLGIHGSCERFGRFPLPARKYMGVDVYGSAHLFVSQPFRNNNQILSGLQSNRSVKMS